MRIAVGADHAGTPLNETAIAELRRLGRDVVDLGTHHLSTPDDYPDYAAAVAEEVVSGPLRARAADLRQWCGSIGCSE